MYKWVDTYDLFFNFYTTIKDALSASNVIGSSGEENLYSSNSCTRSPNILIGAFERRTVGSNE